jgi:hypothetical protein
MPSPGNIAGAFAQWVITSVLNYSLWVGIRRNVPHAVMFFMRYEVAIGRRSFPCPNCGRELEYAIQYFKSVSVIGLQSVLLFQSF